MFVAVRGEWGGICVFGCHQDAAKCK